MNEINKKGLAKALKGLMTAIICLAKICDTIVHNRTKSRGSDTAHEIENHIKKIFVEYGLSKEEK
jgi:hypothetical protein